MWSQGAHWASEAHREKFGAEELWISVKCGESDTTSGLGSNPTVGDFIDKMDAWGATTCFGETSEITGAEMICATRAATPAVGKKFLKTFSKVPLMELYFRFQLSLDKI